MNEEDRDWDGWVPLQADAGCVAIFEPMHGRIGLAQSHPRQMDGSDVYVQLAPGQSCILRTFDRKMEGSRHRYFEAAGPAQEMEGMWMLRFVRGGPELPEAVQTQTLGSWTDLDGDAVKKFSGTACYTITFEGPNGEANAWRLDLGRVCESARVVLNGAELDTLINEPYQLILDTHQLKAENTLEVYVSNLMSNRIADLDRRAVNYKKFYNVNFPPRRRENRGPDGYFNASQWPPQESGLIGPVVLVPLRTKAL
jgi:hypothetical protein